MSELRCEEKIHRDQKEEATVCVSLPTCSSDRLLVLLFIALIEVIQVADICGFETHQAGQTLHVFITEERKGHENKHLSNHYLVILS